MGKHHSHLTYNDRLKIDWMIRYGHSKKEIAEEIGCCLSTIYRELKRSTYVHTNSDLTEEVRYNPEGAQERYRKYLSEKGPGLKLGNDLEFVKYVEDKVLNDKYSPQAVLLYIKAHPEECNFKTNICLSTLYNYIRNGVFLNLEITDCPMPRKKKTGKRRKVQKRVARGTSIEKRPKEVNERECVGHWEMDTVVGPLGNSKKSLLVLTERKTLEEIIEPLKQHTAKEVIRALDRLEREYGEKAFREKFKTITVDNGTEFSDYEGIERSRRNKKARTKLYYCHPYCSIERARNENQNRFIRRHVPKGTNFDNITRKEVKEIENWMNTYPRAGFDGKTADEIYKAELQEESRGSAA